MKRDGEADGGGVFFCLRTFYSGYDFMFYAFRFTEVYVFLFLFLVC